MADKHRATALVTIDPAPVQALAALFDDGLPAPGPGDPLPALWHWVALAAWAPSGATGPDGHPRVGGFLPDVGKPRRMFAGGRVDVHHPLVVGEEVRRTDEVVSVTPKSGRQGDFVLVEVTTRLEDAQGRLALEETQNLVYRDAATPGSAPATPREPLPVVPSVLHRETDGWRFATDPTKLMRFSAATSNGHRIHYDIDYATQVEAYPGLVVHGPLMTIALAEVLRLEQDGPVRSLTHRSVRPLFCGTVGQIRREVRSSDELGLALTTAASEHSLLTAEVDRG
ncbi:dehydratase [Intrasporangium chromatireducens Q5-1]|uniref:Dehydratase n=1 Tax=Intrasporangium chromatireducens Q5-1 TaxID=584657 RepID=W9GGY0_9MICO|nr:MaoC family dehydratase N-terminal domain-containing protein [Intrasporangium chromatireducens]EWT05340.1 dehydratase [Intrasporangium chromatireducens Q5-1]